MIDRSPPADAIGRFPPASFTKITGFSVRGAATPLAPPASHQFPFRGPFAYLLLGVRPPPDQTRSHARFAQDAKLAKKSPTKKQSKGNWSMTVANIVAIRAGASARITRLVLLPFKVGRLLKRL